VLLAIERGE